MTDDLRKLAEAATPGEWKAEYIGCGDWDLDGPKSEADWKLAAAATPAKIIELLDTINQQRELLEMALDALAPPDHLRYSGMARFRADTIHEITNHLRQQESTKE